MPLPSQVLEGGLLSEQAPAPNNNIQDKAVMHSVFTACLFNHIQNRIIQKNTPQHASLQYQIEKICIPV
jgi:hypothetical protein